MTTDHQPNVNLATEGQIPEESNYDLDSAILNTESDMNAQRVYKTTAGKSMKIREIVSSRTLNEFDLSNGDASNYHE